MGSPEASDLPVKRVLVTSGGHEGEVKNKLELKATSADPKTWRSEMKRIYARSRNQRRSARPIAEAILARQRAKTAQAAARRPDIVAP